MIHPLVNNLDHFTDVQLEEKILDLQRKYFQTNNPELQLQVANVLEIYKTDLHTRRSIIAQRDRELMQEKGAKDIDTLINVS